MTPAVDQFNLGEPSDELVKVIVHATTENAKDLNDLTKKRVQDLHGNPAIKWDVGNNPNRSRMLMFDNHGRCFDRIGTRAEQTTNFRNSVRFYQKFGGQTPELFRLLSSPPQREFGFAFFIYSILESCLANVAVVDERLAASLLFANGTNDPNTGGFIKGLSEHQKAGIFPVFTFKQDLSRCTGVPATNDGGTVDQCHLTSAVTC